jgi:predicted nucleic acid-binding protein
VNPLVVDASIAVKWVVEEDGTSAALALRQKAKLIAPDLLVAECAKILWKKVQRKELPKDLAILAARLLQGAEIELRPTRAFLEAAVRIAVELDHPAYDCFYLAVAIENDCQFVTADERFLRKLGQGRRGRFRERVVGLTEAAGGRDEQRRKEGRSRSPRSGERCP